jgi:molybdate transport system ATP-binding protein
VTALSVKIRHPLRDFELSLDLEVPVGVTVLFGPSGAGKSRTLAFIAGLARPNAGRIVLGDEVWFDAATKDECPIHERRVAFVFQSLALFPHLTAEANVAYGIEGTRAERLDRALEMLERMRVKHLAGRKPDTFSGGEAQRVALARAFAMKPRVLLLDEPFSALDSAVKTELLAEVREHVEKAKVPALLVTHDTNEARALGERVLFIEKGRVARSASIDEAKLSTSGLKAAPESPP